jgi:GTP-binding protein
MSMADSVLLLVDAQEGPMPQTRFVTQKAFAQGLKPIVVINKIDKPGARPSWVIDQVFDLFDNLGATDDQLDFQVVYASAINGWATNDLDVPSDNMTPLFETIIKHVKPPVADINGPLQMQMSQLDYNSYVGVIGIGRITRGSVRPNQQVSVIGVDGKTRNGRIGQVQGYLGLQRLEVDSGDAGDIVAITGLGELKISDTVCDPSAVVALPPLSVDEPTVTMTFQVNNSPFCGKEGKYVTSRNIHERLQTELIHNVALKVEETQDPDKFRVSGRGELHLGILIENMRREGYELAVSRPEVILKQVDGVTHEPFETVTIDVEEKHQGSIMEQIGSRKGELTNMTPDGKGRVRMDFMIPSRGLIGFQTDFMTMTSGSGLIYHTFDHYGPHKGGVIGKRKSGVLIANATGKALTNALFNLQSRGRLFIGHGVEVYEGMVIGIHARENDLTVNALKGKQLTNVRASGTDEAQSLVPPIIMSLEQALEFIDNDELVEVTPLSTRIRKKLLTENLRKQAGRPAKA